jgi:hypothetical protein
MLIYMAIYVTMNIGTFAFILTMEKDGRHITQISALSSFASRDGHQGAGASGADVLARRCAAAGGLLREVRGASGGG